MIVVRIMPGILDSIIFSLKSPTKGFLFGSKELARRKRLKGRLPYGYWIVRLLRDNISHYFLSAFRNRISE
jgi:hypothetical protein